MFYSLLIVLFEMCEVKITEEKFLGKVWVHGYFRRYKNKSDE